MSPQPSRRSESSGRSRSSSRRSFLGVLAAAALAGCTAGRDDPSSTTAVTRTTDTTRTTTLTTRETTTATGTTEFPPPPPTSERPTDPQAVPVGTDWRAFQRGPANVGHRPDVTAVPSEEAVHWQFYTAATPPVVADGTLYTVEHATDRTLLARDAATGRERWAAPADDGGGASIPTVADDLVVLPTYSYLFAFDRRDGTRRWRFDVGRGTPTPAAVVDDAIYYCNGSFQHWSTAVFAVGRDGTEAWSVELDGDLRGALAHADGAVYAGTDAGTVVALAADDGSERWRVDLAAGVQTALAAADGTVYVHDDGGTVHALRTGDGGERWTAAASEPDRGVCPAVVTGGVLSSGAVFVAGEAGLHALDAGDGSERWRVETRDPAGTPSVADGTVYFGATGFEDNAVRAVDARSGDLRWRHATRQKMVSDYNVSGVRGPPTPVEGGLYVAAADGLYAFGRDDG